LRVLPRVVRALLPAVVAASLLAACGGGSNGDDGDNPNPSPGGNPCASATLEEGVAAPAGVTSESARQRKRGVVDHNPRWRVFDALWTHRQRMALSGERAAETAGRDAVDIGEIAVVQDEGDLIAAPNTFDLRNTGLRFSRNGSGGYDVRRIDGTFRSALGTRVTLTDDDSRQLNVPFSFPMFGRGQTVAFVNSDGNITFEEEDRASTERNVARLLTGPPRVAPFLADLDPSTGGRVFANAAPDQYTVTWCAVRGFDSTSTVTIQATLLPDGTIEMKFSDVALTDAIVGVSPGRTGNFTPVNLNDSGPTAGGSAAVGERFADRPQLDAVAVAHKFYQSHPDNYDQLVIWTDASLIDEGSFAFESTVANEISGLGIGLFDASRDFGSNGRLRSFVMMDDLGKYPENPLQRVLGENSTLSVLAHETGHRWLAFFEFRDRNGNESTQLLGRDNAHWSFFFDSDASVMEGNDIEDLGGGSFQTVAAVERYSLLDQYAMGLVPASSVPSFFFVENPTNVTPSREQDDAPDIGVRFNGTRRDVLIQDIIAIHGPRNPSSAQAPRVHRQAFLFVVGAGRMASSAQVDKLDRIRRAWEPFFQNATDRRMSAQTTLQ
jgi:hypothetical protein